MRPGIPKLQIMFRKDKEGRERERRHVCMGGERGRESVCDREREREREREIERERERERETVEAALCTYNFRRDWVDKRECARTKEGDP